ncbi:MAG: Uncharacterised protein [Owenweeksia sp. TMED14]|nr:MAG: Uncharacterised protein [Owenweeksia sp. TMED14]|tara:strand:+ start:960 stop:2441 length:1482 start_codon:yes stop_codon:yes gene_type:complete
MKKMLFGLFLLYTSLLLAQNANSDNNIDVPIGIDVIPYWDSGNDPYVQICISVNAKNLYQKINSNINPHVTFLAFLKSNDSQKTIDIDKIKLICPQYDSSATVFSISQSIFLAADTGNLQLSVLYGIGDVITDTLIGDFEIPGIASGAALAPLRFIEKQSENPIGARPQFGEASFYGDDNIIRFYTEAYQIPNNEKSFYSYQLYSLNKGEKVEGFGAVNRVQYSESSEINSLLSTLKIGNLPTGHYEIRASLNVEKMNPIYYPKQAIRFYRINTNELAQLNHSQISDSRWLSILGEGKKLNWYLNGLYPIASGLERKQIEHIGETKNDTTSQRFIQYFWESRSRSQTKALKEAKEYLNILDKVEAKYSSRAVPGYSTDRGRVFLQYGPPTLSEKRPFESDAYPFEIWQYNTLQANNAPYQINKLFVFANYSVAGRNYELLHSDAIGEIKNTKWRIAIQKRSYISEDIDDNGTGESNKFGSRLYNNIFFNGGGR